MFLTKKTICKVEKISPTLPDKAISTLNEMTSFQKYRCHEFWVVLYIFFKMKMVLVTKMTFLVSNMPHY